MPRIKSDQPAAPAGEQSWQERIAERIRKEKVVPIVSDRLGGDRVLGGYEQLLDAYVAYAGFPVERQSFAEMLQFRSVADERMRDALAIKEDYVNFVKNRLMDLAEAGGATADQKAEVEAQFDELTFSSFCDQLGYPRFGGQEDPYLLLANFNLPIYITTSYHDFLEKALRSNKQQPRRAICRWHSGIDPTLPDILDPDFRPTKEEPLVFHLYGIDEIPYVPGADRGRLSQVPGERHRGHRLQHGSRSPPASARPCPIHRSCCWAISCARGSCGRSSGG